MSNMFDFQWDSNELERQLTELAGEDALVDVTENTLKQIAQEILNYCKTNLRESKDNSKSGRKGSRPKGHARDNIPMTSIKRVKGKDFSYITVGWEKGDTSPYFYEKFQEWGTSRIAPHPVFSVAKELFEDKLDELYMKNLEAALKRRIGD